MWPGAVRLHATTTLVSPVMRSGVLSWPVPCHPVAPVARELNVTAADLVVLVPWLIFAAGLVVIAWRLLVSGHARRRSRGRKSCGPPGTST